MIAMLAAALLGAQAPLPRVRAPSRPHPSARIHGFDVAGVTLGMSPAQARAALAKAGFDQDPPHGSAEFREDSWEQQLRNEVLHRRTGGYNVGKRLEDVKQLSRLGPRRQIVHVYFQQRPEGARVSLVKYKIPAGQIGEADFYANVSGRYGQPTARGGIGSVERRWCSRGETRCTHYLDPLQPYLSVQTDIVPPNAGYEITLSGADPDDERQRRAAFQAEVERRAPKNRETAF